MHLRRPFFFFFFFNATATTEIYTLSLHDALPIYQNAAFLRAGFVDVRSERIRTLLNYDSSDDAIGAAFAGGPVALAYSRIDEKSREDAHAEYLASIEPYRNGVSYNIPGEFVITLGRRS